jgi:hypothetical protein
MSKKTTSGRFEVFKSEDGIHIKHVPSGLPVGQFSHIAVKSLKQACEGIERVEKTLTKKQLAYLDTVRAGPASTDATVRIAQMRFRVAMEKEFPNGAWSRH